MCKRPSRLRYFSTHPQYTSVISLYMNPLEALLNFSTGVVFFITSEKV